MDPLVQDDLGGAIASFTLISRSMSAAVGQGALPPFT